MLYRSYIVVWIFVEASAMSAVRLAGQWTYLIHHGSYKSQFTCKSQTRLGSRTFLGNVTVSTLRLIDTWRFVRDHKSRSWAHDGVQREWEGKHTIGKYGLYSGQCRWMMMLLNSCKFCGLQQVRASWFETSMLSTVYGQITVLQYDICACGPLILRKATTPSQMGRQSAAPSGSTDENALRSSHFVPLFQRWDSLHSDSLRALPPLGLTRPSPTIFPLDCYHILLTSTWAHIIYNIYPCHVFKQFHHLRISISDLAMSNIPSLRGLSL